MDIFNNLNKKPEHLMNDLVSMAEKVALKIQDVIVNEQKEMTVHIIRPGQKNGGTDFAINTL